jgi:hypothetical protein
MDKSPLIIESDTPIQKVVEQVISRAASKIYDHIIVVEKGRLKGTVPVRNIIEKLGALQEQKAQ